MNLWRALAGFWREMDERDAPHLHFENYCFDVAEGLESGASVEDATRSASRRQTLT